jgi:hypothetical protein
MTKAEKDCYRLIQEIIVARDPVCYFPGCGKPSTAGHHLFKRDRLATAFDLRCIVGTCVEDHRWAHDHPGTFALLMAPRMEPGQYDYLKRLSHRVVKHFDFVGTRAWLRGILEKEKAG